MQSNILIFIETLFQTVPSWCFREVIGVDLEGNLCESTLWPCTRGNRPGDIRPSVRWPDLFPLKAHTCPTATCQQKPTHGRLPVLPLFNTFWPERSLGGNKTWPLSYLIGKKVGLLWQNMVCVCVCVCVPWNISTLMCLCYPSNTTGLWASLIVEPHFTNEAWNSNHLTGFVASLWLADFFSPLQGFNLNTHTHSHSYL